jgi:hypothetical protein
MIRVFQIILIALPAAFVTACAIYEIDVPPLSPGDRWIKPGYTKTQVRSASLACTDYQTKSFAGIANSDMCMLKQGFIYIDSPYRTAHKRCQNPSDHDLWNLPSCRSLRGELIVTPDESASLPPPVIKDATPNSYIPAIPVAPSARPEQRLQDKIQKDSNSQTNQLLQGAGGRK